MSSVEQVAKSMTTRQSITGAVAGAVGTGVGIGTIGGPVGAVLGGAAGGAYGAALAQQKQPVQFLPWLAGAVGLVALMILISVMLRSRPQKPC